MNLALSILQQIGLRTVEDANLPPDDGRRTLRLHANEAHPSLLYIRIEEPDRVRSTTDAGNKIIGPPPF